MSIKNTCVVGVLILNDNNEILLQRRGDDKKWCIPGGGMEIGESTTETAVREVREETGLNVSNLELFSVFSGASQYHKYPDGNEHYFINVVYLTRAYEGSLVIDNDETLELVRRPSLLLLKEYDLKIKIPVIEKELINKTIGENRRR